MSIRSSVLSFLVVAFSFGCSSSSGSTASFVGTYTFTNTRTWTFEGESDTSTITGSFDIEEGSGSDLIVNLDDCPLAAEIDSGTGFSVEDTTCTGTEDGQTITLTMGGSGTVSDDHLSMNLNGPITVSGGGLSVSGTVSASIVGERL